VGFTFHRRPFDLSYVADEAATWRGAAAVVGLHPDEATEAIVDAALAAGKPFAVVPCCVFPALFPDRRLKDGGGVRSLAEFVVYLQEKDAGIKVAVLEGVPGCNTVVYKQ